MLRPSTYRLTYLMIPLALAMTISCHRTTPALPPDTPPAGGPSVYILFRSNDTIAVWKSGTRNILSTDKINYATGMAISGSDVYVSGGTTDNSGVTFNGAQYWKNGQLVPLQSTDGHAAGKAIAVSGNDVYVGGMIYFDQVQTIKVPFSNTTPADNYAKFGLVSTVWKNGVPTPLLGNGTVSNNAGNGLVGYEDFVTGMAVAGSDVYTASSSLYYFPNDASTFHFTTYWKNSTHFELPNVFTNNTSDAILDEPTTTGVLVDGSDLYIAGYQYDPKGKYWQAMYWKNGISNFVGGSSDQGQPNCIFKAGNDLYLGGQSFQAGGMAGHATYWKNGIPVILDNAFTSSTVSSISVSGADIYAAGSLVDQNNGRYPVYWKNGILHYLSDKSFSGQAVSIIVK